MRLRNSLQIALQNAGSLLSGDVQIGGCKFVQDFMNQALKFIRVPDDSQTSSSDGSKKLSTGI